MVVPPAMLARINLGVQGALVPYRWLWGVGSSIGCLRLGGLGWPQLGCHQPQQLFKLGMTFDIREGRVRVYV